MAIDGKLVSGVTVLIAVVEAGTMVSGSMKSTALASNLPAVVPATTSVVCA
jgi:hypothetical protein